MAVVGMLCTACNGKKKDEKGHDHSDETHQHENGASHANSASDTINQVEFTVGKDSIATEEAHDHQHENDDHHDH